MVRRFTLAVLAMLPILTVGAEAQKKATAPRTAYIPVTVTLRCPYGVDCLSPEGIEGDAAGSYTGQTDGQQGPVFDSSKHLYWPIKGGLGRTITLNFGAPVGEPKCVATGSCRKAWDSVLVYNSAPGSIVNPVGSDGLPIEGGFEAIPVGGSVRARGKINFDDPNGRALLWTVRFNSKVYPGSGDLTVTRVDQNNWVVEAAAGDLAELMSVPTSGKQTAVSDGYYSMPFRFTVVR